MTSPHILTSMSNLAVACDPHKQALTPAGGYWATITDALISMDHLARSISAEELWP
jgi:hypothetical protein